MVLDLVKLDNTTEETELLKLLKQFDDEACNQYRDIYREWDKNVLFYLGKQWLAPPSGTFDGYQILVEDDEHYRPVTNITARLLDLKVSQITGRKVRPIIKPNSDTRPDWVASKLGYLLLQAKHDMDEDDITNTLVLLHSFIFGIGWRADYKIPSDEYFENPVHEMVEKPIMNCPSCGYSTDQEEMDCPECQAALEPGMTQVQQPKLDENGEPVVDKIPLYTNETAVIDPFRLKWSRCARPKDMIWIQESSLQPTEWLKDKFNLDPEQCPGFRGSEACSKIKKTDRIPRGLKYSEEFQASVNKVHSSVARDVSKSITESDKGIEGMTVLHKSYFAPSKKYRTGRLIIWTEHVILYDGLPDVPTGKVGKKLKRWHPYTPFSFKLHPLRYNGVALIDDLIPINKQINSLRSIIFEHLDKCATPERYEFTNVQTNNDDALDGIIKLEPQQGLPNGGAPGYLSVPQMSSEVYALVDKLIAEAEKIVGVTDVVQGLRPAGVDTFRGLQLLRDAAQSADSDPMQRWNEYNRSYGQLKLAVLQECLTYQDPDLIEMMNIIRQNEGLGIEDIQIFTGQDLRNNLNVSIEEVEYSGQSKGAISEAIKDMITSAMISPQELEDPYNKVKILRKMGMGDIPFADKADVEKAETIIEYIKNRQFDKVAGIIRHYDNKGIQLRVWTDWMKSNEFYSLDDDIKQTAEMLLKRTEDELMAAQQQELMQKQKMMAPQGELPPAGEAGAPPPQLQ